MKILISDPLHPTGAEILGAEPGIEVTQQTGLKPAGLLQVIGDYDALIVRSATQVTREVIEAGKRLRVIGRAGIGVDNIDIPAATERGIVVMNTPAGNTITTAEHTISLLLSLARHIPQAYACLQEHRWERKCFMGVELYGKTLGIIGLGRIGRQIAKRVQALGMVVVAHDPYVEPQDVGADLELLPLESLYKRADFITVHTPLTESTRHLIDARALEQMKPGAYIINCARGGIIDEAALHEALVCGQVAGAALDVFEQEPPAADNPLLQLEQVICTPHLGASTKEAQRKVAVEIAQQMINLLKQGVVASGVNTPSVSPETLTQIKPHLTLAEGLGKLAGQLYPQPISQLRIRYSGPLFREHGRPITNAILQALLRVTQEQPVNQVNAPFLAKKQGIEVKEQLVDQAGDYTQLITLELRSPEGDHLLAGTLLSNKQPRIISIDQFKVEIIPQGYILIFFNQDRPGVVGSIGTLLGENRINIANMQFGRKQQGGEAISVFRVDSQVPAPVLKKLARLPLINWVKQVYL